MAEEASPEPAESLIWGEPSERSEPIFIVGCHRSGTSVLRMLMDSHPRISCGPEDISIFWMSQMDTDAWRTTLEGFGLSEDEWLDSLRRVIEGLQSKYAASQGKTRWAQKCPENSLIVSYLDKLFPTCRVIHIVRNPRDVISSNSKKYGRNFGLKYGKKWINHVYNAEKFGVGLGSDRFKTIRYEDLVSDPGGVLKDVFEWLGEPWSESVLRFGERTHYYPPQMKNDDAKKFEVHARSVGRGRLLESVVPLLYVHLRAKALVRRFGYTITPGAPT